ncbi:helix-turn-helix domain-containing protein [Pseudomonas huanghezhanensis]|uniref:helix-turn-helix domain-containing protein n=1 Tax=Pseudomonas huanghezhanensis TaxID=3002903 RepID=UPI0022855679|nr:helix-turn-helix domain-containing protein [Pseudomonas sp. BSw22131]
MSWAMKIPTDSLPNPAARHVLLCMANYAGPEGRGAFPSALTISSQTGLSERTVRLKLDELEQAGFIAEGNQAIAAAYIDRRDRRPVVYDLQLKRGANAAPRKERGADNRTGCSSQQNGVQENAERGAAAAPNTSLNHQLTEQLQQREILDAVVEQDLEVLQATDDRQRFAMFASWEPSAKALSAQLQIAALPADAATTKLIASFKGFYLARPSTVDSNGGWAYRLASWIKRDRTTSAGTTAPVDSTDDEDTSWMEGVNS